MRVLHPCHCVSIGKRLTGFLKLQLEGLWSVVSECRRLACQYCPGLVIPDQGLELQRDSGGKKSPILFPGLTGDLQFV